MESWSAIISVLSEYFSFIYGEKFIALQKLSYIYKLKSNLIDDNNKILLLKLIYSLATSGTNRKLSSKEKLNSLNLNEVESTSESETFFFF